MKATGIVRRIDDLGRIVIPKEIRRTLRIRETDPMEIFTDTEGQIILKKYSPMRELSAFAGKYADSLSDATGMTVCVTDREHIIAAAGEDKKKLINKSVTQELNDIMDERRSVVATDTDGLFVKITDDADFKQEAIHPIICEGDVLGTVFMASLDLKHKFGENEKKMVKTAADFLGRHMES
ncbi:MAG: stage V sporulation protein T [Lachnospira sp.]